MAVHLLDITSEILLHIFQFVDATDLYHLSFVCQRFHDLVRDEYLWAWCEGRSKPNSQEKIMFCENNVNNKTRVMLLAGEYHCETVISSHFFERTGQLKSLTVLALENQYLNGTAVPLVKYPPHLVELSFRNSYVTNYKEFFKQCSSVLKNLRVLCLDQCNWFDSHFLMPISKLESLEILSLYLCKQLSDYDLSYISLAGVHGFKALKILDVRFTGYGDEVLKSFCQNKSIREIYFQGYAKTFQLDYTMRKLDILLGSSDVFHNYLDPYFQVDDTNPTAMIKMFGESFTLTSQNMQRVTDKGVRNYASLHINLTEEYVPPKSILYKPPYGKCTCGYMKPEPELIESYRIPPIPVSESQKQELEKKINLLLNRQDVPDVYFLEVNRSALHSDGEEPADWGWMGKRDPQTDMEIFIMQHMNPMLYQHIMSSSTDPPVSNVIEVDLRRNVVRLLPRCTAQNSLVRIARLILNHNVVAPEQNNVEIDEASNRPILANIDEPSTSQRGVKRKQETTQLEYKHPKMDEPCCSKSLTPEEKPSEVQEDNLCFKEKIKTSNGRGVDVSSSDDEEPANNVALGNEEEACSNAEPAACIPENKEVPQDNPPDRLPDPVHPAEFFLRERVLHHRSMVNLLPWVPMDVFIEHNHLIRRGVQKLGETGIRCLSLRGYDRVTDISLRHLEYLRLDLLDVTLTSVTSAGVEHFKSTNPHCRIIHETACKCRPRMHF